MTTAYLAEEANGYSTKTIIAGFIATTLLFTQASLAIGKPSYSPYDCPELANETRPEGSPSPSAKTIMLTKTRAIGYAMSFDFIIPAEHPALAGHFPGKPIVPGALFLDELSRALEQSIGLRLCSAKQLRFTAPLLPMQRVTVEYAEKTASDYRFTAHTDGLLVARGVLSTLTSTRSPPLINRGAHTAVINAKPLYDKLPHQGDICLLDCITDYDSQSIYCLTKKLTTCPLQHKAGLSPWVALEYAAQALACHGILNATNNGGPDSISSAWVIGVKYLHCLRQYLPQGDNKVYTIAAQILAHQPGIASYEFSLNDNNTCLAFGRLNVAFEIAQSLKS